MSICEWDSCTKRIDDKYNYCLQHMTYIKKENSQSDNFSRIAKSLEQLNWNIGFICEIEKRNNPELAKKIQTDWDSKKKEKEDDA